MNTTSHTNPVIAAFRDHVAWRWVYLPEVSSYSEDVDSFDGLEYASFVNVEPKDVDFARKVILRLVSVESAS